MTTPRYYDVTTPATMTSLGDWAVLDSEVMAAHLTTENTAREAVNINLILESEAAVSALMRYSAFLPRLL